MKKKQKEKKTIIFLNKKGGVGKTVLSDELAFEFDRENIIYDFYDVDGQGGLIHETTKEENEAAEYVIVDTPGQLNENTEECIKMADIIIVPTRASFQEMQPLTETLNLVRAAKKKSTPVIIVLNGWNRFTTYSQFEEWLNVEYPEYNKIVRLSQSEPLAQASSHGMSVIDYSPRNAASVQLKKLWTIVKYELNIKL